MIDTNRFGGKNPNGLYVPLSEDEQEVISRLVDANDMEVVVHGWGMVCKPKVGFGDLRVSIVFRVAFEGPEIPVPVRFLDLELRTVTGISLMRKQYPTIRPDGTPVEVGQGVYLDMAWDIAIDHMSPALVKALKPGALGMTTRRLDPVTLSRTVQGNMHLGEGDLRTLEVLDRANQTLRTDDVRLVNKIR